MPVPSSVSDLSSTASSNYPSGGEAVGTSLDDYLRSHAAIIRQVSDAKVDTTTLTSELALKASLTTLAASSGSSLVGFIQSGTGAVVTDVESKLRETVSVKDFGAVGDGVTDDTAAIQAAVTAAYKKQLIFPDGNYKNTATPTGINDVHCIGSPRVTFSGTPIPMFSGVYTGNKEVALVAGVIRYYANTTPLGSGFTDGETVNIVASAGTGGTATVTTSGSSGGVNTVTLVSGGSGYTNGASAELKAQDGTGRGCLVTLTVTAGAITAVAKKSGWYFLKDGNEEHDPILMGPVTASGSGALNLSVNFADLGLDPNKWTPSGFVCGPDETLADSGVTFGASVSPTNVTIMGTYNCNATGFVSYNGSAWTFSGIGYDSPSYSAGGVLSLTRPANSTKAAFNFTGSVIPVMRRQTAADWGANIVNVALISHTSTVISLIFTDASGAPITTPDTRLKFWLTDTSLRNPAFNFGADPGGGTNIWMVGTFTRRSGSY